MVTIVACIQVNQDFGYKNKIQGRMLPQNASQVGFCRAIFRMSIGLAPTDLIALCLTPLLDPSLYNGVI